MNSTQHIDNFPKNESLEKQTAIIRQAMLELATHDAVRAELPDIEQYARNLMSAMEEGDDPAIERATVSLYTRLHTAGSRYSPSEKEVLKKISGYSCIPGGLSPLAMAEEFIKPESTVVDLGAGNGLQGLLLQCIRPHKRTLQIELSAEMIRVGRIFQQVLGISADRMEWINDDIANVAIESVDFVYVYRPAKPRNDGNEFYRAVARRLASVPGPLVVFSVADCLAGFLDEQFSVFYTDGHLTCFFKE